MTKRKQSDSRPTATADDNILALYLKEINRIPLLTRDEEQKCAREAVKGNRAAKQKLTSSNLRFVVNVAKKYQGQGIPLEDLINEGNVGLISAIEHYDVERGYRFISYAVWWIRQSILKAICEKSRMIRLPMNRINELFQIEKARSFVQEGESEIQEVARLLNMEPGHVEDLLSISRDMISLDIPLYNEKDSSTVGDFVEASGYETPDARVINTALQNDIEDILNGMGDKEADIIRFRYGLGTNIPLSLREIGDRLDLTKERIRQLEQKAISRLKHASSRKVLESYVA
ncbi:MAG: RNA polymerase sigma factor RpoD/SigA [Spirochaetaceae bacterium]|nr:RNA polymerase sigma factor RpoD/SigA [Spirochaetaceae bacterium]